MHSRCLWGPTLLPPAYSITSHISVSCHLAQPVSVLHSLKIQAAVGGNLEQTHLPMGICLLRNGAFTAHIIFCMDCLGKDSTVWRCKMLYKYDMCSLDSGCMELNRPQEDQISTI